MRAWTGWPVALALMGAPYADGLHAAHLPAAPGWRTRISAPSREQPSCGAQRTSWASTVPFRDGAGELGGVRWPARL